MNTYPQWADPFASALNKSQEIATALLAYAAGDAFGVFYEFLPRTEEPIRQELLEKDGWPFGGVSDDTLLTLLTIQALRENSPEVGAEKFLSLLRENIPRLRGLGPTTRTALGLPVRVDERGEIGNTNGAIMRSALTGLYFAPESAPERCRWVDCLVRTTHSAPKALACAQMTAALFSNKHLPIEIVLEVELGEFNEATEDVKGFVMTLEKWTPPSEGISLDPAETLNAVLWVVKRAKNCADAYALACSLGGDTDTVAALAGALFAVRHPDASHFFDIDWLGKVAWGEIIVGVNTAVEMPRR